MELDKYALIEAFEREKIINSSFHSTSPQESWLQRLSFCERFLDDLSSRAKTEVVKLVSIYVKREMLHCYHGLGKVAELTSGIESFLQEAYLTKDEETIFFALDNLGILYSVRENYTEALQHYQLSLRYAKHPHDLFRLLWKVGRIYSHHLSNPIAAIALFDWALTLDCTDFAVLLDKYKCECRVNRRLVDSVSKRHDFQELSLFDIANTVVACVVLGKYRRALSVAKIGKQRAIIERDDRFMARLDFQISYLKRFITSNKAKTSEGMAARIGSRRKR
jgi:tetratricopeptide (TPR) repeat protein